ncbi:SDR family NAD(P)-dependent oxidoreductase [Paenibacillus sp. SC116]|uniref:SDR family NAD(P)-dependent oxidoreductase n=1 Tax=Paenibacillus sp. SC116 TaxID=2968986 RepID=UPI00215A1AB3|nr:SDR family NAD(P)-dependent oxidoreductase [Paenibacillus sp. SC116]MCR8842632.1 SDR family NAD(P)-dependent oxidoreductase [Paenibacillus sp. SC116]
MTTRYFIITGTSRGIGETLAQSLLEDGHYVYGVSRGESKLLSEYNNYKHIYFNLSEVDKINDLVSSIFAQIKHAQADMICLINNAAMLEPLKPIELCTSDEIVSNLQISLTAPMLLSSSFIKHTEELKIRKKIINISSGSAIYPVPDMSVYCTAKAGLNMFTQCVGVEQSNRTNPVEIIAIDPGMVDTALQQSAREQDAAQFSCAGLFQEAYANGQLQSTETVVKHIKQIIEGKVEAGRSLTSITT